MKMSSPFEIETPKSYPRIEALRTRQRWYITKSHDLIVEQHGNTALMLYGKGEGSDFPGFTKILSFNCTIH